VPYVRFRGLGLLLPLALVMSALSPALAFGAKPDTDRYKPMPAPAWVSEPGATQSRVDRASLAQASEEAAEANAESGEPADLTYVEGDAVVGLVLDDFNGGLFGDIYTVAAIGEHIEVWVQNDLNFCEPGDEEIGAGCEGQNDPRNPVIVTQEQIDYLVNEFDTNIYPKMSDFFTDPEPLDGSNALLDDIFGLDPTAYVPEDGLGGQRVVAMISNVQDDNYYTDFPLYIAGFYAADYEIYFDRNIITIDAFDWANRVGDDPNTAPWSDGDPSNDRPNLYEGVFAHEYQHLLHDDVDSDEENFTDEGLADWAEFLVGYGLPDSHVQDAQDMPENSMTVWEDQGAEEVLADYGIAFLFFHYLYGQYGQEFIQAVFNEQANDEAGVNNALASIGASIDFEQAYHQYAVARLVQGKATGPQKGVYTIPDLATPLKLFNEDGSLNEEAFATPGAPPWGSDYVVVQDPKSVKKILFNGNDTLTNASPWTVVDDPLGENGDVLYSGSGHMLDNWAIFEAQGGGTLELDAAYNIEATWDYAFVQVSTDGGASWTSLSNANTRTDTNPDAILKVKENVPGFTGDTADAWQAQTFDLSAFSGPILIGLRYVTDPAAEGNDPGLDTPPGILVDNVTVDGTVLWDGAEDTVPNDVTFYQPIQFDFNVDLVSIGKNGQARVFHLMTDDATEQSDPFAIRKAFKQGGTVVLVITFDAAPGITEYAPYTLDFVH
jgi:immune inhibitor A